MPVTDHTDYTPCRVSHRKMRQEQYTRWRIQQYFLGAPQQVHLMMERGILVNVFQFEDNFRNRPEPKDVKQSVAVRGTTGLDLYLYKAMPMRTKILRLEGTNSGGFRMQDHQDLCCVLL